MASAGNPSSESKVPDVLYPRRALGLPRRNVDTEQTLRPFGERGLHRLRLPEEGGEPLVAAALGVQGVAVAGLRAGSPI